MDAKFRDLEKLDYDKYYFDLLKQLTICDIIQKPLFDIFVEKLNNNHKILVYEKDGKILASGTLLIEQKIIRNFGKVGHIEDIVVDNSLNGLGIGKKLLEELKTHAKNEGCYKVILDCRKDIIVFYEKCGFAKKEEQMVLYF
jgi:glucosamine-phosphate N-acetyltransferase